MMIIGNVLIRIDLPYVESLKGRRSVLNGIKDILKKLNVSVLDVSSEYPKEAELAVVYAAANEKLCAQVFQTIESQLEKRHPELQYDAELEML
jgi:uncharacterized protein YlxP (DUF503 family)